MEKMTIKNYFKKVETANEVISTLAHGTNDNKEYIFYMDDGYEFYKAKTYKEFKKIINEEFIPSFVKELFEKEFELDKIYIISESQIEIFIEREI